MPESIVEALRADVNTERWTLTVGSDKGSKTHRQVRRTIEIHKNAIPLIEAHLRTLKRSDKLLFPIFVPLQKRKKDAVYPVEARCNRATRMLANLVSETRWKMLKGWHTLRHSAISIYLDQGYTFDQIAKWTGHVDAETQKLYTHWFDQQARERMDRLPFDFRAPSGVVALGVAPDHSHRGNSTTEDDKRSLREENRLLREQVRALSNGSDDGFSQSSCAGPLGSIT